jgi:hypothetical protein
LINTTDFSQLRQGDINQLIRAFPSNWMFDRGAGQPNASTAL